MFAIIHYRVSVRRSDGRYDDQQGSFNVNYHPSQSQAQIEILNRWPGKDVVIKECSIDNR